METKPKKLKCVILGSTGDCGKELVKTLMASDKWEVIVCIVKKPIAEWKEFVESGKLKIIKVESMDKLEETEKFQLGEFNTFFCLLGARLEVGDLKKIYQYPIFGAKIALANNIPHFSLLTSSESNENSIYFYQRTKGLLENEIQEMNFQVVSIFRPGVLTNKEHKKNILEKILDFAHLIPKINITIKEVANSMRKESEMLALRIENIPKKEIKIYSTTEMKELSNN